MTPDVLLSIHLVFSVQNARDKEMNKTLTPGRIPDLMTDRFISE